jgi:hypothetical protein
MIAIKFAMGATLQAMGAIVLPTSARRLQRLL